MTEKIRKPEKNEYCSFKRLERGRRHVTHTIKKTQNRIVYSKMERL